MTHCWECEPICLLLTHNQRLLIPRQLPGDVSHQRALFLQDQSGGPGLNGHIPADTWV